MGLTTPLLLRACTDHCASPRLLESAWNTQPRGLPCLKHFFTLSFCVGGQPGGINGPQEKGMWDILLSPVVTGEWLLGHQRHRRLCWQRQLWAPGCVLDLGQPKA